MVFLKPTADVIAEAEHHLSAGHFQDAATVCARGLAAYPGDIPLLALFTAACEHSGQVSLARDAAVRWVEAAPLDSYAHYKLAMIEQRLGNYSAAVERLHIAANVAEPDDEVVYAAREALRALDSIQVQQVVGLAEADLEFRLKLRHDPETALLERGFTLTHGAIAHLLEYEGSPLPHMSGRPPMPS